MWLHLGASRCDLREVANNVGRARSSGDIMPAGLRIGLELDVIVVGLKEGSELEEEADGVIGVGSAARVVRFVDFVGDSTGGGKSLG